MSINIAWICIDKNSRIYEIPQGKSLVMPGLKYTLVTMLLGWWGFSGIRVKGTTGFGLPSCIQRALEAIHINFSGGEDVSKIISEDAYDNMTNYVWNNILCETAEVIDKEDVEVILEIQNAYNKLHTGIYSAENIDFILDNLKRVNMHHVNQIAVEDIFDALKLYNKEE
jgi:hypothetical protein